MKEFLRKVIIFSAFSTLLLYGMTFVVHKGLRKTRSGNFAEWNDIYQSKINADLVVLGSSRSVVTISPYILDSVLSLNSYNLGMDGYNFKMQYYRFKIYLQHNKAPKYIINSLDIMTLDKRKDLFGYTQFLPYLDDPLMREATKGYEGEFSFYDYYFTLDKYSTIELIPGICEFFNIWHFFNGKYKGYWSMAIDWDNTFDEFKSKNKDGVIQHIDGETMTLFERYLKYCQSNNIRVFLVYSPEFIEVQKLFLNRDSIINIYKTFAHKYNAVFLDYSNDPISYNRKLFYNSEHLNKQGSEMFSRKLGHDLKQLIQTNASSTM